MSKCKGPESGSNLTYSMNIEEINLASAVRSGRTFMKLFIIINCKHDPENFLLKFIFFFSFEFNRRPLESFEQGMT